MFKFIDEADFPDSAQMTDSKLDEYIDSEEPIYGIPSICSSSKCLYFNFKESYGLIEPENISYNSSKDNINVNTVISRIMKPTAFIVTGAALNEYGEKYYLLSRKELQNRFIANHSLDTDLAIGLIVECVVRACPHFGAFVDIGCGINALLPITNISVSRIPVPTNRLNVGDKIRCIIKSFETDDYGNIRYVMSMRELLGTWEENVSNFEEGDITHGVVRSVNDCGCFVELAPNLSGLIEPNDLIHEGDIISVHIKKIDPVKMKLKLAFIKKYEESEVKQFLENQKHTPIDYYIDTDADYLKHWVYSPEVCTIKHIATELD